MATLTATLLIGFSAFLFLHARLPCRHPCMQKKDHELDNKKIEAKAAVPKNAGGSSGLTRKMFVGGTVRTASKSPAHAWGAT